MASGNATVGGDHDSGTGKTTAQLQTPTAYGTADTDIYKNWNIDLDNADGDGNDTTGKDDPWDFGATYQYPALKADLTGDGTPTAVDFGGQDRNLPGQVENVAVSVTALGQLTVTWDAPNDSAITGYKVQWSADGTTYADATPAHQGVNASYEQTGLTTGTTYHYRVKATNEHGDSPVWSASASATVVDPATLSEGVDCRYDCGRRCGDGVQGRAVEDRVAIRDGALEDGRRGGEPWG